MIVAVLTSVFVLTCCTYSRLFFILHPPHSPPSPLLQGPSVWLLLHSSPAKMSSGGFSEWLKSLSLSEYEEVLHQRGYTAPHQLIGITQEQLKEIGVVKLGHIKRILKNIPQAVNGEEATQPSTTIGELVSSGEEQPLPTQTHMAGEEEGEAPAPALPPRRRRSSSGFSDSDSHSETLAVGSPERNISPPPMVPLREDNLSEKPPPVVPRRQQSLRNVRRGSHEAEDVQVRHRQSSRDRQSKRMSLPPDSITSIPGLTKTKTPPAIPMRKSSLTPSLDLAVIPSSPQTPQRQPVSSPEPSSPQSEASDQEDEVNVTAEEPYVDQRLLVGGPPTFSPVPPPVMEEEGEDIQVEKKPATTSSVSYVNVEMIPMAAPSSPTPLLRMTPSPKQPIAAPRRRKTAAASAQPSDPKPSEPTSDVSENVAQPITTATDVHEPKPTEKPPPQYAVVQKKQVKRADAMRDEYQYVSGTPRPAMAAQLQQGEDDSRADYQEVGPARPPIYEEITDLTSRSDATLPQSGTVPPRSGATLPQSGTLPPRLGATLPQLSTVPPRSGATLPQSGTMPPQSDATPPEPLATPPLPLGITSAYSPVDFIRDDSHGSSPSSGRTTPDVFAEGPRPLVSECVILLLIQFPFIASCLTCCGVREAQCV